MHSCLEAKQTSIDMEAQKQPANNLVRLCVQSCFVCRSWKTLHILSERTRMRSCLWTGTKSSCLEGRQRTRSSCLGGQRSTQLARSCFVCRNLELVVRELQILSEPVCTKSRLWTEAKRLQVHS
jgi:hypothetical protein